MSSDERAGMNATEAPCEEEMSHPIPWDEGPHLPEDDSQRESDERQQWEEEHAEQP